MPDLSEPIALVGMLRQAGLTLVNVSLGNPYASPHLIRPFEYPPPDGYETPEHPLIGAVPWAVTLLPHSGRRANTATSQCRLLR